MTLLIESSKIPKVMLVMFCSRSVESRRAIGSEPKVPLIYSLSLLLITFPSEMSLRHLPRIRPALSRPLHASSFLHRPSPSDPYPLPLSDPALAAAASRHPRPLATQESFPLPEPLDRTGEDERTLRARLVYQSRKRGMLEGDLLLSTFARDQLAGMGMDELREFDKVCCGVRSVSDRGPACGRGMHWLMGEGAW